MLAKISCPSLPGRAEQLVEVPVPSFDGFDDVEVAEDDAG